MSDAARTDACQILRQIIADLAEPRASVGASAPILCIPASHEVDELAALMLDDDDDLANEALYLAGDLPADSALLAPVMAAGHDLVARLQRVVATTEADDPHYYGAASISVRFSAWLYAARALRASAHGDFSAELAEMLSLSRQRPDSIVLQGDVRRVASYWLQQWTGIAPLPGDPPPR